MIKQIPSGPTAPRTGGLLEGLFDLAFLLFFFFPPDFKHFILYCGTANFMDPDCQKLMSILMEQMHIHPRNISGIEELSCNSVTVRA